MALNGDDQVSSQSETGNQESSGQTAESSRKLPPVTHSLQPPPTPPAQTIARDESSQWRENTKLGLEITGLLILIAYTVFSCLQWLQIRWTNRLTREALNGSSQSLQQTLNKIQGEIDQMKRLADNAGTQADRTNELAAQAKRSADTAQKTYEATNRPYVGVRGVGAAFVEDGNVIKERPTPDTKVMDFLIEIHNFGSVPGTNYSAYRRLFIDGKEDTLAPSPPTAIMIFPGNSLSLEGQIGTRDYSSVVNGAKSLVVQIGIEYDGPSGHYTYCVNEKFLPSTNKFGNIGVCKYEPGPNN